MQIVFVIIKIPLQVKSEQDVTSPPLTSSAAALQLPSSSLERLHQDSISRLSDDSGEEMDTEQPLTGIFSRLASFS